MKIIHQGGFAPVEVEYYRRQVFDNLCSAIRLVLDAMDEWMLDVSEGNRVRLAIGTRLHLLVISPNGQLPWPNSVTYPSSLK